MDKDLPDEIREIVANVVHESRERISPDEILTLRCVNCNSLMERWAIVVQSMNRVDGFAPCSDKCRKEYLVKLGANPHLRVLRTHAA